MEHDDVLSPVASYYEQRLRAHGPTARGVDWNSPESQCLRFAQLLRAIDPPRRFTINDFGCGYGELAMYLAAEGYDATYVGYDVSPAMIEAASEYTHSVSRCRFTTEIDELAPADYTVASGLFNVKLDATDARWEEYVWDTIRHLRELSTRASAFNMLTAHADADRMRSDLYYADPATTIDRCIRTLSRHAAVLHDYGLYEFTVVVRTEPSASITASTSSSVSSG